MSPPNRDSLWLLAGFAAIAAWDATGLDATVSRQFGNAGGFPWREHWLASTVFHEGARAAAWAMFAALALNVWQPLPFARHLPRSERAVWLATTIGCVVAIALLKRISVTSCPWSLEEFGGPARQVSHWLFGVADGGPGRCFPAGHVSTAMCFLPGYFALRQAAPLAARRWLAVTLAAGAVCGATQVVRGAHFVSHALWAAWWCWAVCVAVLAWRGAGARRPAAIELGPAART